MAETSIITYSEIENYFPHSTRIPYLNTTFNTYQLGTPIDVWTFGPTNNSWGLDGKYGNMYNNMSFGATTAELRSTICNPFLYSGTVSNKVLAADSIDTIINTDATLYCEVYIGMKGTSHTSETYEWKVFPCDDYGNQITYNGEFIGYSDSYFAKGDGGWDASAYLKCTNLKKFLSLSSKSSAKTKFYAYYSGAQRTGNVFGFYGVFDIEQWSINNFDVGGTSGKSYSAVISNLLFVDFLRMWGCYGCFDYISTDIYKTTNKKNRICFKFNTDGDSL